jgi:hypothetical protein
MKLLKREQRMAKRLRETCQAGYDELHPRYPRAAHALLELGHATSALQVTAPGWSQYLARLTAPQRLH